MTQEDIVRRMINQKGCQEVSCLGRAGSWNQGVECPFNEKGGGCRVGSGGEYDDEVIPDAKAWLNERGLPLYSSTLTIAHRFKPGDRVMNKHAIECLRSGIITVAELVFGMDCGAFYRFAEEGIPAGSISYCDENMRLADYDEEAGQTKEI